MKSIFQEILKQVDPKSIRYRVHAIRQMFNRRISKSNILEVLSGGTIIEEYRDDKPYPSFLIGGRCDDRPLHIVAAYNNVDREIIVITAYEPDPEKWESGFERRKQ